MSSIHTSGCAQRVTVSAIQLAALTESSVASKVAFCVGQHCVGWCARQGRYLSCSNMTESSHAEHDIEFIVLPTWQGGTFHQASCECGWQSQRVANREVVETEAHRHIANSEQG